MTDLNKWKVVIEYMPHRSGRKWHYKILNEVGGRHDFGWAWTEAGAKGKAKKILRTQQKVIERLAKAREHTYTVSMCESTVALYTEPSPAVTSWQASVRKSTNSKRRNKTNDG